MNSVAEKAASILWKHFVIHTSKTTDDIEQDVQLYHLKSSAISSTPAALLHHFIQSIFIHTQITIAQGSLLSDQLCRPGSLKNSQLLRLEIARRLLVAVDVAGMLNNASVCLQAVVMCYGVLAPMLQQSITTHPLTEILFRCHAALFELPESAVVSKDATSTRSLHHMIAAMAYHTGKV